MPLSTSSKRERTMSTSSAGNAKGCLATVTRKGNEIRTLWTSSNEDPEITFLLLEEYKIRVRKFEKCCEVELKKEATKEELEDFSRWSLKHRSEMSHFMEEVEEYLQTKGVSRKVQPADSVSSHGSNRSSASSISRKLRETKAQREADEEANRQLVLLQQKEALLQQEEACVQKKRREIEIERQKKRENALQRELDLCSQKGSLKASLKKLDSVGPVSHPYFDQEVLSLNPGAVEFIPKPEDDKYCVTPPSMETPVNMVDTDLGQAMALLARNQVKASLPKYEPRVFDGSDPVEFRCFVSDFKSMIAYHCVSDTDRLHYLEKYTAGLPRQVVASCRCSNPSTGYATAMGALQRRYGSDDVIASAYIRKLKNWRTIEREDPRAFDEFSIFLNSCRNVMGDIPALNQLNNKCEIYNLVMKVPYKMRERWRNIVSRERDLGRDETFIVFADFMEHQAKLLNMPMYENISNHPKERTKEVFSGGRKALVTSVNIQKEEKPRCAFCDMSNHSIEDCFMLKKKSRQERLEEIKSLRLCFGCLKKGHINRRCPKRSVCSRCGGSHPTIIHNEKPSVVAHKVVTEKKPEEIEENIASADNSIPVRVLAAGGGSSVGRILCPAVPVEVRVPGNTAFVKTYMGIDSHCTDVFMSNHLAGELGVKGKLSSIQLTTLTGCAAPTKVFELDNLEVRKLGGGDSINISKTYINDIWPFDQDDTFGPQDLQNHDHLRDIPMIFIADGRIGLLVGQNQPNLVTPLESICSPDGLGPYATRYPLGWSICGPLSTGSGMQAVSCFRVGVKTSTEDQFLQLCAREFADDHGISDAPSVEDGLWHNRITESLKMCSDGHYETDLPFKNQELTMPNNRSMVWHRLMATKRKLKKNPDYFAGYQDFMDQMMKGGFAEKVPSQELDAIPGRVWYLVHFGVEHPQKKKLRIVFDAALRYRGVGLNDVLLQGPDLTSSLVGVLLRARQEEILVMADIQKMFYQVRVTEKHRDFLRFLWFPDGDLDAEPEEYRMRVHIFGAVSSPAVANYVLQHSATTVDASCFSNIVRSSLSRDFYVDDWLKAMSSLGEALEVSQGVEQVLAQAGFHLTGYVSNSVSFMNNVDPMKRAVKYQNIEMSLDGDLLFERALGIIWNVKEDRIGFKLNLQERDCTRRGVLSSVFSVYDPLGLVAPVVLQAKKIFQESCGIELSWDDPLSAELTSQWKLWLKHIGELEKYSLPRCYKVPKESVIRTQLHIFADGSEIAYAAVAYLRFQLEDKVVCSLVMAKTRLVPKKMTAVATVPRIELNGAKLATDLGLILKKELSIHIDETVFWTDSTAVLQYLKNEKRHFKVFVANRISYIRANTSVEAWRHVPTSENPADIASRGMTPGKFVINDLWKYGPGFLKLDEEHWPGQPSLSPSSVDGHEVVKLKRVLTAAVSREHPMECLLRSVSTWYKLKRRLAGVLGFQQLWRRRHNSSQSWSITAQVIQETEEEVWKYLQQLYYGEEIERLKKGLSVRGTRLLKLNPIFDGSFLRVGGRLRNSQESYEFKHPIILPTDHHAMRMYIDSVHKKLGHMGKDFILADIRKKLWLVKAQKLIKKVLGACLHCRRSNGRPSEQKMADLPLERLKSDLPAFNQIGIDAFGPFEVVLKRSTIKRYGLVITCLASRAVHLEVLFNLSSDSFICAFRRFVSRRGTPSLVRSDNGTNFVGAEKELRESIEVWNRNAVENYLLQEKIGWRFHTPQASHAAGVWERQIRTIRKTMVALSRERRRTFDDEAFSTLLCEAENILNSRPITPIPDDPDSLEALTPNHLLRLFTASILPPRVSGKDDVYSKRRWCQIQHFADQFWRRWRQEYLPLLQERQKWYLERRSHAVGDLVLLVEPNTPRNCWPLGRVVHVNHDANGMVRDLCIRTSKSGAEAKVKPTVVHRPITKVILLVPDCDMKDAV